jgi:hypothetical protein
VFSPFAVSHSSIPAGISIPATSYNPPAPDNKPQNGAGHRAFCVACRNFPKRSGNAVVWQVQNQGAQSICDGRQGNTACQKPILPDNKTMSAQEILIEEIRRQPEPVAREVLHYLKFLERQREMEAPMDSLVADTWEKLGPAPEVNYDQI